MSTKLRDAQRSPSRYILIVTGATVLSFFASTLYSTKVASKLDVAAVSIATNASPSIQHLSNASAELLRIMLEAVRLAELGRPLSAPARVPMESSFKRLRSELSEYSKLPPYPGERELYLKVQLDLEAVEREVGRLLAPGASGDRSHKVEVLSLASAVARADASLGRVEKLNVSEQYQLGGDIPKVRARATRILFFLNALTGSLALVLVWLVSRATRQYEVALTEQKRVAENRAHEAQAAVRSRDEVLAIVSHDLRNPLGAIRMSAEVLQSGASREMEGAKVADLAGRISRGVERMNRMIEDLLDAARIESGGLTCANRRPEDASQLAREAIDLFAPLATEGSTRIEASINSPLPNVWCDRDQILRVFANLIGNALKFTPSGGLISVAAESVSGSVRFCVTDTGPGISPEHLPHVFDRYWQTTRTDRRGIGLGLYIAKGIVEAHGGLMTVESAIGRGTGVSFTLPAGEAPGHHPMQSEALVSGTARREAL